MMVLSVALDIFVKTMVICFLYYTMRVVLDVIRYPEKSHSCMCSHKDNNPCHVICLDNKSVHTSEQNRKEGEL